MLLLLSGGRVRCQLYRKRAYAISVGPYLASAGDAGSEGGNVEVGLASSEALKILNWKMLLWPVTAWRLTVYCAASARRVRRRGTHLDFAQENDIARLDHGEEVRRVGASEEFMSRLAVGVRGVAQREAHVQVCGRQPRRWEVLD